VLELIVIKLFLVLGIIIYAHCFDTLLIFVFIIMTAREAGVGVALLTAFVRARGNDLVMISIS
jgi:NADH:ubiquinone oxidoreductase subunit K